MSANRAPVADADKMTFVEASRAAMDDAMSEDPSVILLGEDIDDERAGGVFYVTKGLSAKYGQERVLSTPISEQAIIGAAIGAAMAGLRPVAELMFMNFVSVAMDQIANHAAKLRYMTGGRSSCPLTIRTATGAGGSFAEQHSDMLEAWIAHTPGLKVIVPSSPADTYGLLLSCILDDDPCIFIENSIQYFTGAGGIAPQRGVKVPLGKANLLRSGSDLTVITYGRPVADVVAAADELAPEGLSVEVIDLRSIVPLDQSAILTSVAKTKRVVIVHEAVKRFGVGAELASLINEELFGQLRAPVNRVGAPYCPVPYSKPLEDAFLWNRERIKSAIRKTAGI
jgi:pyruvate/2-oxoglutarate/acetoin dehydrogenase E1 component